MENGKDQIHLIEEEGDLDHVPIIKSIKVDMIEGLMIGKKKKINRMSLKKKKSY